MMKKELRGTAPRNDTAVDRQDRLCRLKSKDFAYNSPNKENELASANLRSPQSPLSPLVPHNYNYLSPPRTTPQEILECLRSNKSKENLLDTPENPAILFSGISKDGKFKVQSRSLQGQQLARAVELQKKTALSTTIAASRDKGEKQKCKVDLQPSKISSKENGVIKAYAINTHAGTTRNYNEDRVSVTLNIKKNGIRSQFFAVYDGHGGSACCDYLKDRLHQLLISHKDFPSDPKKALLDAVALCEKGFCQLAQKKQGGERSGSCALIALLVQDCCYVANVGDSRAVLSTEGGRMAFNLSRDHRPIDTKQQQRIFSRGGKIYRTEMTRIKEEQGEPIIGPLRILPGKLSVSRTIGDIEAKLQRLGGTPGVISAEPQIKKFRLSGKEDFMMLCCDGIFERMESMEVIEVAWRAVKREKQGNLHELAGKAVDAVLKEAIRRKSSDNLTAILICLSELKQRGNQQQK